jgi:nanoRNase/pAp phosphatase (c-di-AMP/oligoRNAs hydrolase)
VVNVPYIKGCGLWFDHHSSEEERLGRDFKFEGASRESPSCARLIYEYYGGEAKLGKFAEMLKFVDRVDSGNLTVSEITRPEGWILLGFITDPRTGLGRFRNFTISNFDLMKKLAKAAFSKPVEEILLMPDVKQRVEVYFEQNDLFIKMVREHSKTVGNTVVTDLRGIKTIHAGNRFLVYTLFPEQNISVWVMDGKMNVNSVITVGYSIINRTAKADVGSLMLRYGGGGHRAAGTCQTACAETDRILDEIVSEIR